jgi:hypothetical protein
MLGGVFIPSIVIHPMSMEHGVYDLLKCDFAIAFASIVVTFWFASSKRQPALLVAWSAFATLASGPGVAMGTLLWREASLQG